MYSCRRTRRRRASSFARSDVIAYFADGSSEIGAHSVASACKALANLLFICDASAAA